MDDPDDPNDPFKSFSWEGSPTPAQYRSRPDYKQHTIGEVGAQKAYYEPGFVDHTGKWQKTFEVGYYNHNGVWTPVEPKVNFINHPRVPVTLETIQAYASMRGSVGKKCEPLYCDRFHCAIYQNPSRFVHQDPILVSPPLFGLGDGELCELNELDPKDLWFWDPVGGPNPLPAEIKQYSEFCSRDACNPRPKPLHGGPVGNKSYEKWIKKYPVPVRTKDEMIEAAGWNKVNGRWVDPDDWEQVVAATANIPEDSTDPSFPKYHPPILFNQQEPRNKREEKYFKFRNWVDVDEDDAPMEDVYKHVGSYLYPGGLKHQGDVSEAEAQMSELYNANLAEMAKSRAARNYQYSDASIVAFADQNLNDPEGREYPSSAEGTWHETLDAAPKPLGKHFYITPATFARWAEEIGKDKLKYTEGVASSEESEILPQEKIPPQDDDALFRPGTKEIYGICKDSEDFMSGMYSAESSPRMIHSPHGRLNILKMPKNFRRSYPRHFDHFMKQGFRTQSDFPKYPNYSFGTASEPETFTQERIINHFVTDGVTKEKAQEKFHDTQDYIKYLRVENESHEQKRLMNSCYVNHFCARKIFSCHAVAIAKEGLKNYVYDIERQKVEMQNLVDDIPRESLVGLTRLAEADEIAEARFKRKLDKAERLAQDFLIPERLAHQTAQAAKQVCLEEDKPCPIAQEQYVGDTQSYPPNLALHHVVDESGYFKVDHPTKKQYRRFFGEEVERSELEIARMDCETAHKDIQAAEYRYQTREAQVRFRFLQAIIEDVQDDLPEDQRGTDWKAKQEYLDAFDDWKPVAEELEE